MLIESVSTVPSSSSPTSALAVVFLNRASRSRRARPFSPPPFTLTAAHPSPPAPPHVCRVQPKHPCIACRTHSAQAVPLPRPEHAHTHRPPCRPHVAGAHVSGSGWRLPVCEKTFFSLTIATSTPPTPPTTPTTPTPPTPPTPRGVQTESPWPNQRGCAVCLCDNLVRGERHGVRVCMYCTYLIL